MGDNPGYAVPVYLSQLTNYPAFDYEVFAIDHHPFFGTCLPSPAAVIAVAAAFTSTVPPIPTARLLAEAVPDFKFVTLPTNSSQNFICYSTLLSIV